VVGIFPFMLIVIVMNTLICLSYTRIFSLGKNTKKKLYIEMDEEDINSRKKIPYFSFSIRVP